MASPQWAKFATRPVIMGTFGVVSSTHWLASQVGMSVLEKGGNAFDAAVATAFALQVVEPHMNGLGGEVVLLLKPHDADPKVLCGQGIAPAGATIAHYRAEGFDLVPGSGILATVVPGAFDAWMTLLRDYGTMSLADVLEPAIGYANRGWPMTHAVASTIAEVERQLREHWTSSAAIYLPNNSVPTPGELFANRQLSATYMRLLKESAVPRSSREQQIELARGAFYRGFIADAIDKFVRHHDVTDLDGRRSRGVLTGADLAAWTATYESPVSYQYGGMTVFKAGPWSQGPVFLQTLALLRHFDVAAMDPSGIEFNHILLEAMKLAFADRDAFYGDPNFVDVPIDALLSDSYNEDRRKLIGDAASNEIRPGSLSPTRGRNVERALTSRAEAITEASARSAPQASEMPRRLGVSPRNGDTCNFEIIDSQGNLISATPSGGWLQHSPVIEGLGFSLNIRAQGFSLEANAASALGPGRRPRTTLSPTLALHAGEVQVACGSPGADNQEQWLLQFFLKHCIHGLDLQAAIDAPACQTGHLTSSIYPRECKINNVDVEARVPEATIAGLRQRGHEIKVIAPWSSAGRVCAVARNGKVLYAAATPRARQAYAVGR